MNASGLLLRTAGILLVVGTTTARAQPSPPYTVPQPAVSRIAPERPPNGPASLVVRGTQVELRYQGAVIFRGTLASSGVAPRLRTVVDSAGGTVTQIISWTAGEGRLTLRGTIHGTGDAFAVEADPRDNGVPIVRHSVGPSYNRLNRAVYARSAD